MNDLQALLDSLTPIDPREDGNAARAKRIGVANKGKPRTAEDREKTSKALTGRKLSPEHIQNIAKGVRARERNPVTVQTFLKTICNRPGSKHFIRAQLERDGLDDLPRWPDGKINIAEGAALKGWKKHTFQAAIVEFFPNDRPTRKSSTLRGIRVTKPKAVTTS